MKNKKKVIAGFFAILFSLLLAFVVFPTAMGLIGNTTDIVKVKKTIKAGDPFDLNNLKVEEVNKYNLPENAIKNINDVIGKYATARLEEGDYVLNSKVEGDLISSGNYLSLLDGNKQVVSVAIKDLASGVTGKIAAGDVVSVFNNADVSNGISKTYPELQYVLVLAVSTATGVDLSGEAYTKDSELPATVTLLVNKKQAELLTAIDKQGNPAFTLVYPRNGDESVIKAFLDKQDAYFKTSGSI
jgi:pilus assembly protein CpaB